MAAPSVGAVVLVPFPFSDLSSSKLRPAFVVADCGKGDWICIQITSNPYSDRDAVEIDSTDFESGSLQRASFARPGKIFTANEAILVRVVGQLRREKVLQIKRAIVDLIEKEE